MGTPQGAHGMSPLATAEICFLFVHAHDDTYVGLGVTTVQASGMNDGIYCIEN